ncbi:endopolygalacturonase [Filimonas lacunae]|nr:endopolygalacturonase [Filimonas lacunae]
MITSCCATAQQLVTYPAPAAVTYAMHNDDYTVRVRQPGGQWQDLYEYKVKVDLDKVQDASMVYFDMEGPVEVMVRKNNDNVREVKIRPQAYGIQPKVQGNVITFTLPQPRKISVECNGDKLHNLHVFANEPEKDKPRPGDTNVIYFAPGLHLPKDTVQKEFSIPSGKTVYIAGGAVVRGKLVCENVHNVHIKGRGIIDQAPEGILVDHSSHVTIEGITFINPRHYTICGGASQHLTIRNVKSFSSQGWSDGIDLMSCSDVVIDDVFLRNSDDCIALYGSRWNFYGNVRNCTITNAILWADVAHPINIGLHGNATAGGDTLENILFKNIHILEQDEDDPDYEGCMAISCGDNNLVRQVRFENIYVDDFEEGQLLNIRVVYNSKYNAAPGRGVQDISFKNIQYTGSNTTYPVIKGLDANHKVNGVTFEGLRINGKPVRNATEAHIITGPFAENIIFNNESTAK